MFSKLVHLEFSNSNKGDKGEFDCSWCSRYLAVVHPIASMSVRTESHAFMALWIVWIVILTSSIPALFIHGEVRIISLIFSTKSNAYFDQFFIWVYMSLESDICRRYLVLTSSSVRTLVKVCFMSELN